MTMMESDLLRNVPPGRLRPLNQTELKAALADLKDIPNPNRLSPLFSMAIVPCAILLSPH